ncbi:hypothetical protein DSM3645_23461 [Blastopirellula marina DSM 3645]|uniref:Uncharacterized protein n=2 Tax=Blastopirellula marina TaxID=124 RepID=A3ZQC6_9BACT|nr:hypothetical protein DSM3645_23461 [Blastopirellula marina DSM 3645]
MKPICHLWIVAAMSASILGAAATSLHADEQPIALWEFGPEEQTPLHPVGGIHRDVPGPRPPKYPDFSINNASVNFDGSGSWICV